MKYEWRKMEKSMYLPGEKPIQVMVPKYRFLTLEGKGDPNDPEFSEGIGVLYSLAYAVTMMPKKGIVPPGYFEYTVYPLEATWSLSEGNASHMLTDKKELSYTMMVRQPDFVTEHVFEQALEIVTRKENHRFLNQVSLVSEEERSCVQMLHVGPYDDELESFALMDRFCEENGLARMSSIHREIYLSDPRKVVPESLKTVLRYRIKA